MKKKFLILGGVAAMMLGGALPALAQEITAILFSYETNEELGSATIQTDYAITFTEQGVNILNADKNLVKSIPYTSDESYYIQLLGVAAGIEDLKIDGSLRLKENPVGASLEILGYADGPADLKIYDLSGKMRIAANNWDGAALDVTSLSPGMYLVSINRSIIKFIKK